MWRVPSSIHGGGKPNGGDAFCFLSTFDARLALKNNLVKSYRKQYGFLSHTYNNTALEIGKYCLLFKDLKGVFEKGYIIRSGNVFEAKSFGFGHSLFLRKNGADFSQ